MHISGRLGESDDAETLISVLAGLTEDRSGAARQRGDVWLMS
jgi:hypothetical protein